MIETYKHHSPSSLNLFAAEPAMWVLEKIVGIKQPGSATMHRGTAVEHGVAYGLSNSGAAPSDCVKLALIRYDTLTAMSGDHRREKCRDGIAEMVAQALDELCDCGPPSQTQGFIKWQPDGLRLPIVGYYDFYWEDKGLIIDLKTTEKMPSEVKPSHARQVAFYAMSDNLDARLTYVTPKKCQTFQLENIREHREALYQIAKRVENLLALSDDPQFFLNITAPNLDGFYFNTPAARQLALEHFGI